MKNLIKIVLFLLIPIASFAQRTINGNVYNEQNKTLPGATVKVKNTTRSTITDENGFFKLDIPKGKNVIVVSYIGFETQEIVLEKEDNVKVVMIEKSEAIKEVVVIGYGEVKKRDVTGAVTSIKPTEDAAAQAQTLETLLQGRAAGVIVSNQGNEPNAPISVQIRGINSLQSNTQPLYVVDGIIVSSATEDALSPITSGSNYLSPQSGLQGINPRDIESIEILKDASATAIYGSRGSNGVILITTKKGKAGKTKFNFSSNTKIGNAVRPINVLDARGYAEYQNKSRELKGFTPNYNIAEDGTITDLNGNTLENINWHDEIYRTTVSYNNRFTVSGGMENNNYYFAAGHLSSEGLVPRSNLKQTDFSLNLNNKLSSKLKMSTKMNVSFTNSQGSKGTDNLGGTNNSIVRQIISAAPFQNFSGNFFGDTDIDINNSIDGPRAWITDYDDISKEIRGLGGINLEYAFNDVFKYRTVLGVDYRKKERQVWYGTALFQGAFNNGQAGLSILDRFRYNIDNTLMFNKKFNNSHRIDGTVGVVIDAVNTKQIAYQASDFPIKDLRADGISSAVNFQKLKYEKYPESLLSFLGRVNYSFKNKYNLTASFRTDGSNKFSKENRFSYFPAVAFAWLFQREKMFKNFSRFNEGKLRLGWGQTGNQGISSYRTIANYNPTDNFYSNAIGGSLLGITQTNIPNPNLVWETTNQYNAGLDLGFFNKRLTFTIDGYYKKTYDLLQNLTIGPSAGFSIVTINRGDLENRGAEFTFNGEIVKTDNVKWSISGNISRYRNKITNLGIAPKQFGNEVYSAYLGGQVSGGNIFKSPANIFIEGEQAALFWGYQTDGIINTPEELAAAPTVQGSLGPQMGDVQIIDQNGDGLITADDKTIIGNPNPDFTYGFGTSLEYKNLSLNLLFNGVYGNDIINGNLLRDNYATGSPDNIRPEAYYNAWSTENPNGTYPRINYDLVEETDITDREIQDGSFLRLSSVSLGYDLPLSGKSAIESLNFSIMANNLLLFTKYNGYDPEVNSFAFDPSRKGIDWQSFPNQRSFTFGVNINF